MTARRFLGSTSAGTLALRADQNGVRAEVLLPPTQVGRDVATLIRRGDIASASFRFAQVKEEWRQGNPFPIRRVTELRLYDVSLLGHAPAYPGTQGLVQISERALAEARILNRERARSGKAYAVPVTRGGTPMPILSLSEMRRLLAHLEAEFNALPAPTATLAPVKRRAPVEEPAYKPLPSWRRYYCEHGPDTSRPVPGAMEAYTQQLTAVARSARVEEMPAPTTTKRHPLLGFWR